MKLHHNRKLWYSVFTSLCIMFAAVLSAIWPAFRPSLDVIVGGLIATLTVFTGANVTQKYVQGKNGEKTVEATVYGKGGSIYEPGQPVEKG